MFASEVIFVRILLVAIPVIIMGYFFPEYFDPGILAGCGFVSFTTLTFINIRYARMGMYKYKQALFWLMCILVAILFLYRTTEHNELLREDHFSVSDSELLQITVDDEPQEGRHYTRFSARVTGSYNNHEHSVASGRLVVILYDTLKRISVNYGSKMIITNNTTSIDPPFNPAEFNFKAWLAARNIYHQAFITPADLKITGADSGNPFIAKALTIRKAQIRKYEHVIRNREALAVASTLILGYRADLEQETLSAYSKTGTIHALSVSGAHVAIIYLFLNYLLFFLDRSLTFKAIKVILICLLLWGYALLTGFSPSVLRAIVMLTIMIIAKLLNRTSNSYNVLAFSAICLLVYDPFLLFDVGFQLSYLAVIGLIYYQPRIYNLVYFRNTQVDKLWNLIALSTAAQFITFPLSILYFHQFPVYFLFANLFIVLPVNLIMGLGTLVLIPGLDFLGFLLEWVLIVTNESLKWMSALPFSVINQIYLDKIEFSLLLSAVILGTIAFHSRKKKILWGALICCVILQFFLAKDKLNHQRQLEILFFTLKKNYAIACLQGKNAIIITDLTHRDKNFQFHIQPALDQRGISGLKLLPYNGSFSSGNFLLNNRFMEFAGYRLLLLDSSFQNKRILDRPHLSSIWIHARPGVQFNELADDLNVHDINFAATNNDWYIERSKRDAENAGFKVRILKKNPAYLINLNENVQPGTL